MSFSVGGQKEGLECGLTLMRLYSHKLSNGSVDDTNVTAACQPRVVNETCSFGRTHSTNHRAREQLVQ